MTAESVGLQVKSATPRKPAERSSSASNPDFDLLIIGTGGAGVAAAIQAAGMGSTVGIVERGTLGGTCVNIGCIPSKHLIEAAAHHHMMTEGFPGITACTPRVSWTAVIDHKDALVAGLRQAKYADVLASYPGVTLLHGHAQLAGGGSGAPLVVRVSDGANAHQFLARKVLLATGTRPSAPPIAGLETVDALDSTTAMQLAELPPSMLVLGGSAVGLELGQMFSRLGVKVTVVELASRLLPLEDEAVSRELEVHLRAEGVEIHTGARTTRIERGDREVVLHVSEGGVELTLRAARLLVAVGRRANTDNLGLESVGVVLDDRRFIQVDATMGTSNPDIFAAGDVTGGPGYVYVAAAGGRVAAENAVNGLALSDRSDDAPQELDLSIVPNVTFTSPQVGSVGLTEARAHQLGTNVQVAVLKMDQVPRALVSGDSRGLVKMVADATTGRLLGVHAVTPFAGELMGEATLALRFGLSARDIAATLHPYLTWGEALKLTAQGFSTDIRKLSCCA